MDGTKEWKEKTRQELITTIDKFLDVSNVGGWGLKYQHPVIESYEDGGKVYDTTKISGVNLFIQFGFENNMVITSE